MRRFLSVFLCHTRPPAIETDLVRLSVSYHALLVLLLLLLLLLFPVRLPGDGGHG